MSSTHRPVEPDEDGADVTVLFATTMSDLDTRPETMADLALRRGRPRRRRRIVATVAAGTVAVALAGGLGAYGLTTRTAAPAPNVGPAATTGPTPSAASTSTPSLGRLPARVAALYLTRIAPSGTLGDFTGQEWYSDRAGEERDGSVEVRAQLDRGEGQVGLEIGLQASFLRTIGGQKSDIDDFYGCGHLGGVGIGDCELTRGGDGSVLMTYTEALPVGRTSSARGRSVVADHLRPDGTRVVVRTGNVANLDDGGTPRRGVTPAEAGRLATDPAWDLYRTASAADVAEAERVVRPWGPLPGKPRRPTAGSSEPAGPEATAEPDPAAPLLARVAALYLKRLAPSGTLSDLRGQEAADGVFVGSRLDRGEGKVGLQINVQGGFADPGQDREDLVKDLYRCEPAYDDCTVVRKDDGSILMTYTSPPEDAGSAGGRAVTADHLRPDGTRVVVLTGNVSDTKYGGEPRRGVSLAEARRIVTDPVWDLSRKPSAADVAEAERVITPWTLTPG